MPQVPAAMHFLLWCTVTPWSKPFLLQVLIRYLVIVIIKITNTCTEPSPWTSHIWFYIKQYLLPNSLQTGIKKTHLNKSPTAWRHSRWTLWPAVISDTLPMPTDLRLCNDCFWTVSLLSGISGVTFLAPTLSHKKTITLAHCGSLFTPSSPRCSNNPASRSYSEHIWILMTILV